MVRESGRRSAATLTPVLLTVGIVTSLLGAIGILASGAGASLESLYPGDAVITGEGVGEVTAIAKVTVPTSETVQAGGVGWQLPALGIDPAPDPRVLDLGPTEGWPDDLRGRSMIVGREYAAMMGVRLGGAGSALPVGCADPAGRDGRDALGQRLHTMAI